jgi:hypothetical protein
VTPVLRWAVRQAAAVASEARAEWRRLNPPAAAAGTGPARSELSCTQARVETGPRPGRVWNQPGALPVRAEVRIHEAGRE